MWYIRLEVWPLLSTNSLAVSWKKKIFCSSSAMPIPKKKLPQGIN
jgi:hypothetical protein